MYISSKNEIPFKVYNLTSNNTSEPHLSKRTIKDPVLMVFIAPTFDKPCVKPEQQGHHMG